MTPLLDTHVLLWWLSGGSRLSAAAATFYATGLEHRIPLVTKVERLRTDAAIAGDIDVVW
ncbi:MAG TPA: hypothetical protein VM427_11070 [Patescibacteria group bacterium]|nr:hypothetical protein [Patescibacteria group bacterium]